MRSLYPPIAPRNVYRLPVDGGHTLYVEDCGRADGIPIVFLHGGPGSGCKAYHRQFFNPDVFRIVLFDQRGAGRSTPRGATEGNDSRALVADLEFIRERLGIERWALFGGSWGVALALLYAQAHPQRVTGMVLRGAFLARARDVDWFFGDGVRRIFPQEWERLTGTLQLGAGDDLAGWCNARLREGDAGERERIARAWAEWSGAIVTFSLAAPEPQPADVARMIAETRIEAHYASNGYFLDENELLARAHRLPPVPVTIIHGRRDLTCPVESAWALHRAIPGSTLHILREAGHLASEPAMIDALVRATETLAHAMSVTSPP